MKISDCKVGDRVRLDLRLAGNGYKYNGETIWATILQSGSHPIIGWELHEPMTEPKMSTDHLKHNTMGCYVSFNTIVIEHIEPCPQCHTHHP
jgi:hypothetical protein